jgi:hypothetical protein
MGRPEWYRQGEKLEYIKKCVRVQDPGNKDQVLLAISSLRDLVVVNIAGGAEMEPVLFTEENLHAILAAAPEQLLVEGLPPAKYKKLAREKIDRAVQSALALRAGLRAAYVADLAAPVRDLLSQLDQVLQLLRCYALQNARSGPSGLDQELQDVIGQLAASSFERGDNVRCMDGLHHQIVPALKKLLWVFRK